MTKLSLEQAYELCGINTPTYQIVRVRPHRDEPFLSMEESLEYYDILSDLLLVAARRSGECVTGIGYYDDAPDICPGTPDKGGIALTIEGIPVEVLSALSKVSEWILKD